MTARASPVRDRLIGLLRATPRMTTAQVAAGLGCKASTAGPYLHRAALIGRLKRDANCGDHARGGEFTTWSLPDA